MATRIGINGFGRIGRSVLRIARERPGLEVVAVNDLYDNEQLAYLLTYDTVMGRFPGKVTVDADNLYIDGDEKVLMTAEPDPGKIPWGDMGVDVVIEATGVFRTRAPWRSTCRPARRRCCSRSRPRKRSTRWSSSASTTTS